MEQPTPDETQDTAQPERKRVRFFIDPSRSDEEIYETIMAMAHEHFDLPERSD